MDVFKVRPVGGGCWGVVVAVVENKPLPAVACGVEKMEEIG
jgi:hypothetical protein